MIGWMLTGLGAIFIVWAIFIYNRLVALKNEARNAWHQIDVQLKRRYDLIPNLVAVVKGYMEFEKTTLQSVTEARARAMSAVRLNDRAIAENTLTQSLGSLFAVIENYPVLKSNENVMNLQEELVSTENRIAFARQLYNDLVANFRTRLEVFPDNIIAAAFAFKAMEFFSADKGDRSAPAADIRSKQINSL